MKQTKYLIIACLALILVASGLTIGLATQPNLTATINAGTVAATPTATPTPTAQPANVIINSAIFYGVNGTISQDGLSVSWVGIIIPMDTTAQLSITTKNLGPNWSGLYARDITLTGNENNVFKITPSFTPDTVVGLGAGTSCSWNWTWTPLQIGTVVVTITITPT